MFATCPSVCARLCPYETEAFSATLSLTGGYKNCCIIAYFVYICVCFLFTSLYDFVI